MIDQIKRGMIEYFGADVKQVEHALKVYGFAGTISGLEKIPAFDRTVTEVAAILHDIGIEEAERKYSSRAGKFQEIEGPPIAREIMRKCGVPLDVVDRVCFIVGNHHSYEKVDRKDFRILVESDFIVNISEGKTERAEIMRIRERYFKTAAGKEILDSLYLR